jgi:hypothetical protein
MGLFKKKSDPISERSKTLNAQIAALEAEIQQLGSSLHRDHGTMRVRSSVVPRSKAAEPVRRPPEPIFEPVEARRIQSASETPDTPAHYNELGVRKFDLAGVWQRLQFHFRGPPSTNPKLVNYLAAGSIKGLRPLRYEKRVARNRFVALTLFLLLLLWGIVAGFFRH